MMKALGKKGKNDENLVLEIIMWVLSLIVIIPLLIVILGSFKTQAEAVSFGLGLPEKWQLQNYIQVIEEANVIRAFLNSVFIAGGSVFLTVILGSMAAFVLARKKTKMAEFIYIFFYIGLIIPIQTIPTISLLQDIKIFGTYFSVILLHVSFNAAFAVFIYTGFFKSIPRELEEAAMLDGASRLTVFFKIIFPLAKPTNVTVFSLIFLSVWNDINIPLYFMNDSSKWTMSMTVYNFFGLHYQSWQLVFADIVLMALPVLLIYLVSQKYLVSGLLAGSVKS